MLFPGQIAHHGTHRQNEHQQGGQRPHRGGGDILGEADAVVVQQNDRDAQAGGQPLVVGQRGEKDPHGDQGRAQQEKGQDGAVGGKQIDVAELGEDQRIDRDDGQGIRYSTSRARYFPAMICTVVMGGE